MATSHFTGADRTMGAESPLQHGPTQANGLAEAIYFDSGDQRLFGWLHESSQGSPAAIGVVLCNPFGYEAICSHRSIRAFAEALAEAGFPTLRFDYLGTGDSGEIDPRADQLEVWTRDVLAGATELRHRSGVTQICFLGIRLGALLAMRAAAQCKTNSSLVLISPILSGRRYLRELRTIRMAASAGQPHADVAPNERDAGAMEISGFRLSAATLASLKQLDFTDPSTLPAQDLLIIDGATMPVADRWAQSLGTGSARATYHSLPGLVEMVMTAPQFAAIPREMIAATRDWMTRFATRLGAETSLGFTRRNEIGAARNSVLNLAGEAAVSGAMAVATERPVFLGRDGLVFGIITEPRPDEARRRAVILLNAGADHHIGASRLYVSVARRWAYRGYIVLRMDLAGLGDSGTRPGRADNDVFPAEALEDIRTAVDFIRTRYGVRECTLAGLCSGAYHALRAAAAGIPINRILMVNPQNYFWKAGDSLETLQLAEVVKNPTVYRERIFSMTAWKRLLSGQVNVLRIVKIYLQRPLLALESAGRDIARRLRLKLPNDLGSELQDIVARGVRVAFVFAQGEPGIALLKLEAGASIRELGDRCHVHIIDNADHVFTNSGPRSVMEKVLSEELFARPEWMTKRHDDLARNH
jgi:alpha-beta hydrolase superfamily lysophospholipase